MNSCEQTKHLFINIYNSIDIDIEKDTFVIFCSIDNQSIDQSIKKFIR